MEQFGITTETSSEIYEVKDIKSIKDIPSFSHNPFTEDFTLKTKTHLTKALDAKVHVGEEYITNKTIKSTGYVFAEKIYKDNEPFCRIFAHQTFMDIKNLSPATCKLLLHIMYNLTNFNLDYVIINPKLSSNELDVSLPTIYNGIVELSKNYVITKKKDEDNIYWLNPYVMFRGDRKKIRFRRI